MPCRWYRNKTTSVLFILSSVVVVVCLPILGFWWRVDFCCDGFFAPLANAIFSMPYARIKVVIIPSASPQLKTVCFLYSSEYFRAARMINRVLSNHDSVGHVKTDGSNLRSNFQVNLRGSTWNTWQESIMTVTIVLLRPRHRLQNVVQESLSLCIPMSEWFPNPTLWVCFKQARGLFLCNWSFQDQVHSKKKPLLNRFVPAWVLHSWVRSPAVNGTFSAQPRCFVIIWSAMR